LTSPSKKCWKQLLPFSADRPISLYNLGYSYLNHNQEPTDLEELISNFRLSSFSLNLSLKGRPSMRIRGSLQWAHLAHKVDNLQAIRHLPQVGIPVDSDLAS
jgi:hypothetical protein